MSEATAAVVSFGEMVKAGRTRKGMSQRGLAKALSITQGAVSAWETGDGKAEVGRLADIADALDLDIADLVRAAAIPTSTS